MKMGQGKSSEGRRVGEDEVDYKWEQLKVRICTCMLYMILLAIPVLSAYTLSTPTHGIMGTERIEGYSWLPRNSIARPQICYCYRPVAGFQV